MNDWLVLLSDWFFPELKISYLWILKLFAAIISATLAGGLLGFERELLGKPAGLKTLVFVTVGSSLFAFFSFEFGKKFGGDPLRIASNIATGIGFLGAGAIVRRGDLVEGLTTSAIIWVCGALGIMIGAGYFLTSVAVSFGGLIFLKTLENLEKKFIWKLRCIPKSVVATFSPEHFQEIMNIARTFKIHPNCKLNHVLVITQDEFLGGDDKERGKGRKIRFQASFCQTHTDIPILRSAEEVDFF